MAEDIAELGFKAKTDELDRAGDKLDEVGDKSKKTGKATDRLGQDFDKLDKKAGLASRAMGGLGRSLKTVGGIIAGLAAGVLSGISLQKFIDGTVTADKVQAQLGAALRSTKAAAGQSLAALNAHAAALQRITIYGDETTNEAQALLLTFTKIQGDVFPKATEAVQNVATAMGGDLKGAALQVGKALNDPVMGITALSRSGITFSESQKKVIKDLVKTGEVAKAQGIILAELETQFGGSAKAARETLGGALTAFNNAFGDLFELGKSASEPLRLSIEGLVTAVSDPAFAKFAQMIGGVLFAAFGLAVRGITLMVNGINTLVNNIDFLKIAMIGLAPVFASVFGPAIVGAIASVASAISGGLVGAVRLLTAAIAMNPLGLLAVAISTVIGYLLVFKDELHVVAGEAATVGDYLRAVWSFISEGAQIATNYIVDRWNWLYSEIGAAFDMILEWGNDMFSGLGDGNLDLTGVIKGAINTIIGVYLGGFNAVRAIWERLPDAIGEAAYGAVNLAIDALNWLIDKSREGVNVIIAGLNSIPGINIGEVTGGKIDPIDNPYAGAIGDLAASAKDAVTNALATDYVGLAGEALGGLGESLRERANEIRQLRDEDAAMNQSLTATATVAPGAGKGIEELGNAAGGASKKTKDLNKDLKESAKFARDLVGGAIGDLRSALDDGKITVKEFTNVFLNALDKIVDKLLNNVLDALFQVNSETGKIGGGDGGGFGGFIAKALGFLFPGKNASAKGNAFGSSGRVTKYATGGVVASTTPFATRSGELGVMGEAGPEAILPLTRTRGGDLGVKMAGGAAQSGTVVQIIDQRGNDAPPIREETSTTSDGREMKRFIISAVKDATNRGEMDGAQRKRFGNRPVGVIR